jgi:hypothetical protein
MPKLESVARRLAPGGALLAAVVFAAASCTVEGNVGFVGGPDSGPPGEGFAAVDAGPALDGPAGLTSYCPSNKCPAGWTTCPGSRFACDVNFQTDRQNCGACGLACPEERANALYECVEGRCAMVCWNGVVADCDHAPDNGCETQLGTSDNCGFCGDKCDASKPCIEGKCGCDEWSTYCPTVKKCIDTDIEDTHCGACGNACELTNGDPPLPNAYYGCVGGQCGRLKCAPNYGNCDGIQSNGCEASLRSPESCGGCGIVCAPGQECQLDTRGVPRCVCPSGQTFCPTMWIGDLPLGACFDLSSDRGNCGACGVACQDNNALAGTSSGACIYGKCSMVCDDGRANCNGSEADECEVNIRSDPMNCGGCGKVCDAVAGQACVEGRCVVEPCDQVQDAGEVTR